MNTYNSFIASLILSLGAINPLHASPFSDAMNLPSWFQDQEQNVIPQPGGEGPSGWLPVDVDNSPEPPKPDPEAFEPVDLHLTSSAFANGESIPLKYTCDGSNVSPPLSWSNVPAGTKSIVLLVADAITGKSHWVMHSIAPTVKSLSEAFPVSTGAYGGIDQGVNDFALGGYSGPCPNLNNDVKTYSFTLMALDYAPIFDPKQIIVTHDQHNADGSVTTIILSTINGVSEESVIEKAINHVIGKSTLIGTYKRTIKTIDLKSSEFENGRSIPVKFTCDGANVSPPLNWKDIPEGTKSLVLTVTDNKNKSSWIAFNIEPPPPDDDKEYHLPEEIPNVPITNGFYQGTNDSNVVGYSGPCPEISGNTQLYTFTLRALNEVLNLTAGTTTKTALEEKITGSNLVGIGMLTGTYKRTHSIINLTSSAFDNNANIPAKYTCDGDNVSPPLAWKKIPDGTKSLALLVTDEKGIERWVGFGILPPPTLEQEQKLPEHIPNVPVFNLDATSQIFQGIAKKDIIVDGKIETTDIVGYAGPCPVNADETKTYNFTLMALNNIPDTLIAGTATKTDLTTATNGHVLGLGTLTGTYKRNTVDMTLTSSGIVGGEIDVKHTCDGANVSPPLAWDKIPDGTKSFIVLVTGADKSTEDGRKPHWVAFNIGADNKYSLAEAIPNSASANGISQGINAFNTIGYSGPCPTLENDTRTYSFTVIAVNATLDLPPGTSTYTDVLSAAKGKIVGSGSMLGTYTRKDEGDIIIRFAGHAEKEDHPPLVRDQPIDVQYTCDGKDISPPLGWNKEEIPPTAKSLVLLMADKNQKSHWVVFNIPTDVSSLSAAIPKLSKTHRVSQGMNGVDPDGTGTATGTVGYSGPCPEIAGGSNTYTFTIMAISKVLNGDTGEGGDDIHPGISDMAAVEKAISGYVVKSGSISVTYTRTVADMSLQSSAFENGKPIDAKYTCDGDNISPPLNWSGVPAGTQSIVLLMSNANNMTHWTAFNIAHGTNRLPEGVPNMPVTNGLSQGINDFSDPDYSGTNGLNLIGYYGPCPTTTNVSTAYTFTVMALNYVPTNLKPGESSRQDILTAVSGHLLGSGSLTGTYTRTTAAMTLTSSFANGAAIPIEHTCDGANTSPPLTWTGQPASTKSFIVLATKNSDNSAHWLAFNINASANSLPAAVPNSPIAGVGGVMLSQASNDFEGVGYYGPCPNIANVPQSYSFTVIALDTTLDIVSGNTITANDILAKAQGHVVGSGSLTGTYTRTTSVMTLTSTAFANGAAIPVKHTCDGTDVSPPLSWSGAPASARSLILLTTDASRNVHWVAFNIGTTVNSLPEGVPNTAVANGVSQGGNNFDVIGYSGPCPDVANVAKSYTFTIMALDTNLDLTPGFLTVGYEDIIAKATGHIVGSGSLSGTYTRTTTNAMTLKSTAFANGVIPVEHTCDGANTSPKLDWTGVPTTAKSLVLLMTDTVRKSHWVAFNIPVTATGSLPASIPNASNTSGLSQGPNGFIPPVVGYSGPCPATAGVSNTYTFSLIALSTVPTLTPGTSDMAAVEAAINGNVVGTATLTGTYTRNIVDLNLESDAFANGEAIPIKYTCDGENVSPQLSWDNVPAGAKSLVLLVADANTGKSHWVMHSIAPTTKSLSEAFPVSTGAYGGIDQGVNDYAGISGYSGPCPNLNNDVKTYSFTLMALDYAPIFEPKLIIVTQEVKQPDGTITIEELYRINGVSEESVIEKAINHVIGKSTLTGTYKRTIKTIDLKSSEFNNGDSIPIEFTCDGTNVSPPLNWDNVPEGTKNLILLVTDNKNESLWVAYNIDASVKDLPKAIPNVPITNGLYQGTNKSNVIGYSGPCPEISGSTQIYNFTLMALNEVPNLATGATIDKVREAISGSNLVGIGMLTGTYTRTAVNTMTLTSSDIVGGVFNDPKYTCDGTNISPQLDWGGVPATAKSLVLTMTDAARKSHWVAFSIQATATGLARAMPNAPSTNGISQGLNGFSTVGYSGPCPTTANVVNTYTFSLMALDVIPTTLTPGTSDLAAVEAAANGHLLGSATLVATYTRTTTVMTVESLDTTDTAVFTDGVIPVKYTCDGANVSPPLKWSNAPTSAKSFIVLTTDASRKSHWVAFNIGSDVDKLDEGVPNTAVANGVSQGGNDFSVIGYSGPCPDVANVAKSYTFTVMALDITLNLTPGALTTDSAAVMAAASGHIVGSGSLTGTYTRTTTNAMTLSSTFANGAAIPVEYTCDGANTSPHLNWTGVPTTAKSLVLIMTDAARKSHWVAFNIPVTVTGNLPASIPNAPNTSGLSQGPNGFTPPVIGYSGPCPATAGVANTYTFSLMALSVVPTLIPGTSDMATVEAATNGKVLGTATLTGTYTRTTSVMTLTSTAFANGTTIPPDHTCVGDATGRTTSPPLAWPSVPSNARSLVLLITDTYNNNNHWVAYNIPAVYRNLPAGIPNISTYNGFSQGTNDLGNIGYTAPCPPIGDPAHTYVFTLMALDIPLPQDPLTATYDNVFAATAGHILGMAELTGTVERSANGSNFFLHSVFADGDDIPQIYTCDGSSLSPPLNWDNVPASATSLVLTMTGTGTPDVDGIFDPAACHWAALNIPATQTQLAQGQANTFYTGNFYQALNYMKWYGYAAPCPAQGTTGTYLFNLTALSKQLTGLTMKSTCDDVIAATQQAQVLATASLTGQYTRTDVQGGKLSLSSSALTDGADFVNKYTCDGDGGSPEAKDVSLPLSWSNVPKDALSLAIVMTDGDADTTASEPVAHWIVYDIPANSSSLPENVPRLPLVYNSYQGTNDFEKIGYNGPCPTPDDGKHRYIFEIFALTEKLNIVSTDMTYAKFLTATTGKIIESATLEGSYGRTSNPTEDFTLESKYTDENNQEHIVFSFGQPIPSLYTCDSQNVSPELTWINPPANTTHFAMLLTDFNAPVGSNALWILYNVPYNSDTKDISKLNRNVPIGATPTLPGTLVIANQAINDSGVQGYSGPCPPAGGGPRQYVFKLVALSSTLTNLTTHPTYAEVMEKMQGKVLGTVELNGTYERETGGVGAFKLTSPAFADNGILPKKYRSSGYEFIRYKIVGCGDDAFCVVYDDGDNNPLIEIQWKATSFANEISSCTDLACALNDLLAWGDDVIDDVEGENVSPPLHWDNVPSGTKSLVLFLKNEEAAESNSSSYWTGNAHWIVYDIPPELSGLDEDVAKLGFTGGFYQGLNDAPWAVGYHEGGDTELLTDDIDILQSPQGSQPVEIPGANIAYKEFDGAYAAMKAHYKLAYYNGYWGPFLPSSLPTTTPSNYVFTLIALSEKLKIYPYDRKEYETFYQYLTDKMLGKIIGTAELLRVRIPGKFTLTIKKTDDGSTVTSTPAGINCGNDCTENYNIDTQVTLTATPDDNSTFDRWTGDCDADGKVTMNANKTCTARFN